jgi:negative regulator of flagellin synthesis FlgM
MKIGPSGDSPLSGTSSTGSTSRTSSTEKEKTQSAATPATAGESSTTVALSSTASSLMQGVSEANADFDTDKVSRVSRALSDGSYVVNAEVIADKLISNAKELLTNARQ